MPPSLPAPAVDKGRCRFCAVQGFVCSGTDAGGLDLYQVGLAVVEHLRKVSGLFKVVTLHAPSVLQLLPVGFALVDGLVALSALRLLRAFLLFLLLVLSLLDLPFHKLVLDIVPLLLCVSFGFQSWCNSTFLSLGLVS